MVSILNSVEYIRYGYTHICSMTQHPQIGASLHLIIVRDTIKICKTMLKWLGGSRDLYFIAAIAA